MDHAVADPGPPTRPTGGWIRKRSTPSSAGSKLRPSDDRRVRRDLIQRWWLTGGRRPVRAQPRTSIALDATVTALVDSTVHGWPLVEAAQRLVHRRFRVYSCLFWWESPSVAFERGRGYCVQYNGALMIVLRALGIECRLVHASRVTLAGDPGWRMGHVWVQARLDGVTRDVCAGRAANRPGTVDFQPVTTVRPFGLGMRAAAGLGTGALVGAALLRSAVFREPRPDWIHRPMDPS